MLRTHFTLIARKQLTHDVFELTYTCPDLSKTSPKAWQYVMFQLAPGLNRAYSLASFSLGTTHQFPQDSNTLTLQHSNTLTFQHSNHPTFTLIIKRIPDGRGSPMICDAEVGSLLQWMIPLGHFVLMDTPRSKCFIGTGTGFAPLYCQLREYSKQQYRNTSIAFIFGVRNFADAFYEREILDLWSRFEEFEYVQYFSRESDFSTFEDSNIPRFQEWYVTDWITRENINAYEEFYLCGSPAMVKDAREKLEILGIEKERVFWEQF